ncbi:unnamed protein product [Protopolystoma xenopodis]|uniref:Uncharacterized protein n=1 Tax=Protopolystoma xenopodis TaxID=117903 RepID=A0A448WKE1_9PLAT|nr:unnamed protein product [Protopolystoma xenopodis]
MFARLHNRAEAGIRLTLEAKFSSEILQQEQRCSTESKIARLNVRPEIRSRLNTLNNLLPRLQDKPVSSDALAGGPGNQSNNASGGGTSSSSPGKLPTVDEAWNLPIPAELTQRQMNLMMQAAASTTQTGSSGLVSGPDLATLELIPGEQSMGPVSGAQAGGRKRSSFAGLLIPETPCLPNPSLRARLTECLKAHRQRRKQQWRRRKGRTDLVDKAEDNDSCEEDGEDEGEEKIKIEKEDEGDESFILGIILIEG